MNQEAPVSQRDSTPNTPATSGLAVGSLVCGILGFFTAGITGIVGVVLGHVSLSKIKKSAGTMGGRGLAIGGLVTGYLSCVVLPVVAMILGGAIFAMRNVGDTAKRQKVEADFKALGNCIQMYKLNAGYYPTTAQGLKALVEKPTSVPVPRRWTKLIDKVELDPWGNPYDYRYPGSKQVNEFEIFSSGPDGVRYTPDDIGSQGK